MGIILLGVGLIVYGLGLIIPIHLPGLFWALWAIVTGVLLVAGK